MHLIRRIFLSRAAAGISATMLLLSVRAFSQQPEAGRPGNPARDSALWLYHGEYLGSAVTTPCWTGSVSGCDAGKVPASVHAAVLRRIRYFRKMAGLTAEIALDSNQSDACQQAALMIAANKRLDHRPPNTWKCWSPEGAEACSRSNLALGSHASDAVTTFMEDAGAANTACGHRRWLLYSMSQVMGHGSTANSCAILVTGIQDTTPSPGPEFIAWPPAGFVPAPLVFARWTFSIPRAGFQRAKVSITGPDGKKLPARIVSTSRGYGDNTLVFEPSGTLPERREDVSFTVTVKQVMIGDSEHSYTYRVTIFQP